jgi:hypothetical protein
MIRLSQQLAKSGTFYGAIAPRPTDCLAIDFLPSRLPVRYLVFHYEHRSSAVGLHSGTRDESHGCGGKYHRSSNHVSR